MIHVDTGSPGFLMWAAAWLDSEGSIGMREAIHNRMHSGPTFRVLVSVSQVAPAPLLLLEQGFGGGVTAPRIQRARAPIRTWVIHSRRAVAFLAAVHPYLVVKGAQADLAIQAGTIISGGQRGRWRRRTDDEVIVLRGLKEQLHALNGWGDPERRARAGAGKRRGPEPHPGWAVAHERCGNCGTIEVPHVGHGLCRNCYGRFWAQHRRARPARKPVPMPEHLREP